jgi:hypothetical protein
VKKSRIRTIETATLVILPVAAILWRSSNAHASWPTEYAGWAVCFAAPLAKLYLDYRRRQAAFNWPTVSAIVQRCSDYGEQGQRSGWNVHYSYSFNNDYRAACIIVPKKRFAGDPSVMLKAASILIRVNPQDPAETVVEAMTLPGLKPEAATGLIAAED